MNNFMYDLADKAKANSKPTQDYSVSGLEDLICEYLQCNFYSSNYVESDRLKSYGIAQWYCTDDYVGTSCVFLDEELLAFTHQTGRKSSVDYYFVTEEMSYKFLTFLREVRSQFEDKINLLDNMSSFKIEDFSFLKDGFFQIDYEGNILYNLYKVAYFKKENKYLPYDSFKKANDTYTCKDLLVTYEGKEFEVSLKNVYFKCEGS